MPTQPWQLEERLAEEQRSLEPVKSLKQALLRRDVLLLSLQYFCWSLGVYGFVLWLPTIVRQGSSLSMGETGLLSAIPYLAAIILMIVVSYLSDKTLRREALVWPFLLLSGIALLGSFLLAEPKLSRCVRLPRPRGRLHVCALWPFLRHHSRATAEERHRRGLGLINSCGALGAFAGSYLVGLLQALTGSSRPGFLLMSVCADMLFSSHPRSAKDTSTQPRTTKLT